MNFCLERNFLFLDSRQTGILQEQPLSPPNQPSFDHPELICLGKEASYNIMLKLHFEPLLLVITGSGTRVVVVKRVAVM